MNREEQKDIFRELMLLPYREGGNSAILDYAGNLVYKAMVEEGINEKYIAETNEFSEEEIRRIVAGKTFWSPQAIEILCPLFHEMGCLLPIDYRKLHEIGREVYRKAHDGKEFPQERRVSEIPDHMVHLFLMDEK
jgi:hypothetical protein